MKSKKIEKVVAQLLFLAYLAVLTYFLFFAESVGRTDAYIEYHYNYIPFDTMRLYIEHRDIVGIRICFINLEGNILAFLPFGFFLPVVFEGCRKLWITVLLTACFSFAVELIQLITKVGTCDIDDLILNTLGGFVGYLLFLLVARVRGRRETSS